MTRSRTVGILIFPEVEVLDFCGPFEVLSTARDAASGARLFDVSIVAETDALIRCRGGLLVQPHHAFADAPSYDIIIVPGGYGTRREIDNPVVIDWIRGRSTSAEITASVCTGAFLLAKAGVLNGIPTTTHWETFDELRALFPEIELDPTRRVIDTGRVVTSAGVSAGIDMALALVERLHGRNVAESTARDMEYDWRPSPR